MTEADKAPWEKKAAEDKTRHEKDVEHMKKHGWFTVAKCGCKSTECTHEKPKKKRSKKAKDDDDEPAPTATKKEKKAVIQPAKKQ